LHNVRGGPTFDRGVKFAPTWLAKVACLKITWEDGMAWKTPKIVEVPVGMEINMYACAARK
jgi:coenzyme PQQ precursor peptide PqqA